MATRNSWAVSTAGGILTTEDVRLHIAALITPGSTNVKARTGLRPGGSTAAVSPGLVAAQGTPNKTVSVQPFQAFQQTGRGAGSYIQCLDVATNLDLLTAHPADPSLQRNDLIVAQQNDTTYGDANNTWSVIQVVGTPSGTPVDPTPSGSTDYYVLARVRVTALASTITAAMIDDLRPPWAVGLGGLLPVKNATDRGTLTPYDGMAIWRIDRKWVEVYSIAAGGWLVQGTATGSSVADITSAVTTPYAGQLATTTGGLTYMYLGSAWTAGEGVVGGKRYVTATTLAVTSAATEGLCNVDTGNVALDANSAYQIEAVMYFDATVAADTYDFYIRDTNLAGAALNEAVAPAVQASVPLSVRIVATYKTTTAVTKQFVATFKRVTGTGNASIKSSGTNTTFMLITKLGPSSLITDV